VFNHALLRAHVGAHRFHTRRLHRTVFD
jgi:hypothetical protein